MEVLEWPLEDKVQDLPFKKLDSLICFVLDYLSSSGDDTEVEHSSSSNEYNEGNKNGQIFSTILEPESVCRGDCLCNTRFQQHYTILDQPESGLETKVDAGEQATRIDVAEQATKAS
ncbi:hypothetical protein CTI12_AA335770 [Artemisia annua]|uniref:Uncharacterized protein n=1 Tax=Artemisia annua TaxID=35608 RepID=A0A2U1MVI4_ARTAN|nr:hypothetical protein CTI12_AA335770 [Artemisia annua]